MTAGDSRASQPFLHSAVAPELANLQESAPKLRPLAPVISNRTANRRMIPLQQSLFALRENQKVVELPAPSAAPRATSRPAPARPSRKKADENQAAFDFAPTAPAQPFRREIDRRNVVPVAPLSIRAAAAVIDSAIVLGATALLACIVRLLLGSLLPVSAALIPYASVSLLSVALCYKLVWCLFCQPTLGLQWMGLRVLSFTGQLPSLGQCVVRILTGWLSLASVGMGLLWAVVDAEQLTWHDHISQTYLAMDRPANR